MGYEIAALLRAGLYSQNFSNALGNEFMCAGLQVIPSGIGIFA